VSYQWRKDGVSISGKTSAVLTLSAVTGSDAGVYDVVVTDRYDSAASAGATLSVRAIPVITAQPTSQTAFQGGSATFHVAATGAAPLAYRWRKNGVDVPGAVTDTLVLTSVAPADAGNYDAVVTGPCGVATSLAASLVVRTRSAVTIDEIRVGATLPSSSEYFELAGAPGETLDALTYVVIGDGPGGSGVVESAVRLNGLHLPSDGHLLVADDTFALSCGGIPDLALTGGNVLGFESDDDVTHLLVQDFTGFVGQDLDVNDDCVLDFTPWSVVLDEVSLVRPGTSPPEDCAYATVRVGPDQATSPRHVYRCPDAVGAWRVGNGATTCSAVETPGLGNPPCILVPPISVTVCEGASASFTVVADGTGPLSYQWSHSGALVPGATDATLAFAGARIEDGGSYRVRVTDAYGSATSGQVVLTVEPFLSIRRGNVNAAAGPPVDVLFLDGGVGADPDRTITVSSLAPFQLQIVNPPSRAPGAASYVVYVWRGSPTKQTRETLAGGIGLVGMPTPMSGRLPQPVRIANTLGTSFGTEVWPARFRPTRPAPYTLVQIPSLRRVGTFYFQGIIEDDAAPNGHLAVTNGIVLVSQ
jgi:Ig-like domain-containing protein/immunoglobulin I-set domain protein